jgi:hypothetical protein
MWPYFYFLSQSIFISIKPVLSDHLSYVTIFHCSLGRSHKTGLTVYSLKTQRYWETVQLRRNKMSCRCKIRHVVALWVILDGKYIRTSLVVLKYNVSYWLFKDGGLVLWQMTIFFDNLPSIASRSKTKYLHNYSRLYLGKTYNVENIYYLQGCKECHNPTSLGHLFTSPPVRWTLVMYLCTLQSKKQKFLFCITKYLHNYSRLYLGKTYNVENIYYDFI